MLALGLSVIGAFIDMTMSGNLGKVFEGAYFVGCVGAVCLVQRRNLFGPMVQAPLILAVTVPAVVLLTKGASSTGGTSSKLLALGLPLVTGFPTMAITTGATIVIGVIRFLVQRRPAGATDEDRGDLDGERRRPSNRDTDRASLSDRGDGRRPRTGERPASERGGARDDRDRGASPRDRDRSGQPPARGRSGSADRGGRAGGGRPAQDRNQDRGGQSRDRDQSDRGGRGGRAQPDRGRGQARGGGPGGGRDDGRRQPPRRRDDDYFE